MMKLDSCLYWLLTAYLRCLAWLPSYVRKDAEEGAPRALLTGTFHSSNWIRAHLQPMLDSSRFDAVTMVTTSDVCLPDGVETIRPPSWLSKIIGDRASRILTFVVVAVRRRPEVIGGFHLIFSGLIAILLSRVLGARSIYFCFDGPAEVVRPSASSQRLETALTQAVSFADVVVTMGSSAAEYMKQRAAPKLVVVNPGGVHQPQPEAVEKTHDLIFLGRLVPVKNLAAQIEAVSLLRGQGNSLTLAIVGDGECLEPLQQLVRARGVQDHVSFAGRQSETVRWLRSARVFVLSSYSEGLALSLMEALAAGIPAVVPNVGDLTDLVKDGYNGVVLTETTPQAIADAVRWLLTEDRYAVAARNAAQSALYVSPARAAARWANTMQHLGWHKCAA